MAELPEKVLIEFNIDTKTINAELDAIQLRLEYIIALAEKAGIDLSIKSEL